MIKRPRRVTARQNATHLGFVRKLPCTNCKCRPQCEAAHIRFQNGGGLGLKPPDSCVVSLCRACHLAQHNCPTGEVGWWGDIDRAKALAADLYAHSGDLEYCTQAVMRF
jgi:hypothetical protein